MGNTAKQLIRYGVVGFSANAIGYLLYLLLNTAGMGHKVAMTIVYAIGVFQTFVLNKRWSFRYAGGRGKTFARYVLIYILGYIINFVVLSVCVDKLQWSPAWVQAVMVFVVAAFIFVLQKCWVFKMDAVEMTQKKMSDGFR